MKNLKVLHCIHSLAGGGAETQARVLATSLNEYGIVSAFFCINSENHDLDENISLYVYDKRGKYDLGIFKQISYAIDDFEPDVIHAWLPAVVTIPSMFLGFINKIPVLFSYRNKMFFHRAISYPEYFIALFCSQKIISNNFIGQSNRAYQWLYNRKYGETIYNAVKQPHVVATLDINQDKVRRFLFVGRLTKQKNIHLMIQALSELKGSQQWYLDIFGVGELESELKEKVKMLGLEEKVFFKGFCGDVQKEMVNADLLIFPSIYEGMPNVLVEALAVGLPVIASNIIASKVMLGDTNCVCWFETTKKESLISAINTFMADPSSFKQNIENGILFSSTLSIELFSENYDRVYREIAYENRT